MTTTTEVRKIQGYGWKPSLPDHRDLIADTSQLTIRPEVDPRKAMPAIYDQGQLGSCTGNAIAAAIEYDASLTKPLGYTPSRLDIYYGERSYEGTVPVDSGAYGRDGFKFAHVTGVIPETDWPYDIAKFKDQPPTEPTKRHKIGAYKAVPQTLTAFKAALSNRQTIIFGFSVYESFESQEVATTGIMPIPGQGESQIGGHEVLLCGYLKDHPEHGLVRNSWSASWGIAGYFLMPWTVLLDPNMASDFRTIYRPTGK
jgi:C1A family cysteine protease